MASSKSSCFSLLSTTAFILFVLLFVSSLSSSVAEKKTSRVQEIYTLEDIQGELDNLAHDNMMAVVLFYDDPTHHIGYKNETYDALSVKYFDAGVRFYTVDVDLCDKDCQEGYGLKMTDLPNVLIFDEGQQYATMSGSQWDADSIRDYICDIREDSCDNNPDSCIIIKECADSILISTLNLI